MLYVHSSPGAVSVLYAYLVPIVVRRAQTLASTSSLRGEALSAPDINRLSSRGLLSPCSTAMQMQGDHLLIRFHLTSSCSRANGMRTSLTRPNQASASLSSGRACTADCCNACRNLAYTHIRALLVCSRCLWAMAATGWCMQGCYDAYSLLGSGTFAAEGNTQASAGLAPAGLANQQPLNQ